MKHIIFSLIIILSFVMMSCKENTAKTTPTKITNGAKKNVKPKTRTKKGGKKVSYWDTHQKEIGYTDQIKVQLKKIEAKYIALKISKIKVPQKRQKLIRQRKAEYNKLLTPAMRRKRNAIGKRAADRNKKKNKK